MSKYIKIKLGEPDTYVEKEHYLVLHFVYYLRSNNREWTGYIELDRGGLDAEFLLAFDILRGPTLTGAYKFNNDLDLLNSYLFIEGTQKQYWLDTDCLYSEEDVEQVLIDRNPVGLIPANEFEEYDEELLKSLGHIKENNIRNNFKGDSTSAKPFENIVEDEAYRVLKRCFETKKYEGTRRSLVEWFLERKGRSENNEKFSELYDTYINELPDLSVFKITKPNQNAVPIELVDSEGNIVKTFESKAAASKALKCSLTKLNECIKAGQPINGLLLRIKNI